MIKLRKLYSHPEVFTPIKFEDGINLILGEKVPKEDEKTKKDRKTNGVGKSMCIEFINFCLLKDERHSRVMKIPLDKFNEETQIKLDLHINGKKVTISRTKKDPSKPTIEVDDQITLFSKLEDALNYLNDIFYQDYNLDIEKPSFRELIAPLIRDEDSEFKDIISCYDVTRRISPTDLIGTHLYFFNIDASVIDDIKSASTKIESATKTLTYLQGRLTDGGRKKISSIKAEFNAVEREIQKAEISLEKFESEIILQQNKDELIEYDSEIDNLRIKQEAIRSELKRIELMPKMEAIDIADIEIIYNKFKSGLGKTVSESLNEVINFKKKIDNYQNTLINDKAKILRGQNTSILERIMELDSKRSLLVRSLDNKGVLRDYKNSFSIYSNKKEELSKNLSNLDEYEILQRRIKALKLEKDNLFAELDNQIFQIEKIRKDFENTLVSMHDYIMGNAEASFDIQTVNTAKAKQIIKFIIRIDDDGSHSVERTKVFIYDVALMLNNFTNKRHPMFLIHDNIFDVDQDTLVQSINYLNDQEKNGTSFQYILTLNRDKIENEERQKLIKLDIDSHTRASFTRQKRFLRDHYKEI